MPNKQAKYTILISHGNAEDIGNLSPIMQQLHKQGFAVFAYDYDGYGLSTGKPTEQNAYQDIATAYDYLTNELAISGKNIIAYGISIGAAATIDLATKKPLAGIITQSPFVSAFRVITHIPILLFDKFNNLQKIAGINCPILIIHGTKDRIVPIWHSKKLLQKAKPPKHHLWIKDAGHNDLLYIAQQKFWKAIDEFANKL